MATLADYECQCGHTFEDIAGDTTQCPECQQQARRIITPSGVYCSNQDTAWLKTVHVVVDKESTIPETREFLRNPTRENHRRWMQANGIRPREHGEKAIYRDQPDYGKIADRLMQRHKERKALTLI